MCGVRMLLTTKDPWDEEVHVMAHPGGGSSAPRSQGSQPESVVRMRPPRTPGMRKYM